MNDTAPAPLAYAGEWHPMSTTTPDAELAGKPAHTCIHCLIATKGAAVAFARRYAYKPARGGIAYRWEISGTIVKDADVSFWSFLPKHPLAQ